MVIAFRIFLHHVFEQGDDCLAAGVMGDILNDALPCRKGISEGDTFGNEIRRNSPKTGVALKKKPDPFGVFTLNATEDKRTRNACALDQLFCMNGARQIMRSGLNRNKQDVEQMRYRPSLD